MDVHKNTNPASGVNIEALMKRGSMALEDGDWAKADEFFEAVLNLDAEYADAYIGKALAQEQVVNLDALAHKRISMGMTCDPVRHEIAVDRAHIDRMVSGSVVPGYLNDDDILEKYDSFDRGYASCFPVRERQRQAEEAFWNQHKLLNRAAQFARGASAGALAMTKAIVMAQFDHWIEAARRNDAQSKAKAEAHYQIFLAETDAWAAAQKTAAEAHRESVYQDWVRVAREETDISKLATAEETLLAMGGYGDSVAEAERCRQRIEKLSGQEDADNGTAEVEQPADKRTKPQKTKKGKLTIALLTVVAVAATVLLVTKVIIPAAKYARAEQYLEDGQYYQAIAAFGELGDYRNSLERAWEIEQMVRQAEEERIAQENAAAYEAAEELLQAGDYQAAIEAFEALGDYSDSQQRAQEIHKVVLRIRNGQRTLATGFDYSVGLKSDGTVVAVGKNEYGQCDVSDWTDIIAVSVGDYHTVGLKPNGTVVSVGNNEYGQCDVSDWTDIIAIGAGDYHTVGLKSDGTVVSVGNNDVDQCDVSVWTDIIAVSAGRYHTVGLKSDGTVVAVGNNGFGQCDVSDWTDIVEVSAGGRHTVGLKTDGTVVAVGRNDDGQCDVSDWTGIVEVSAGGWHTIGLKSDGTVVAVGNHDDDQCDVSDWTGIIAVSTGSLHTVGLKSNGTLVAKGWNVYGQCDVSDWTDIRIPE